PWNWLNWQGVHGSNYAVPSNAASPIAGKGLGPERGVYNYYHVHLLPIFRTIRPALPVISSRRQEVMPDHRRRHQRRGSRGRAVLAQGLRHGRYAAVALAR